MTQARLGSLFSIVIVVVTVVAILLSTIYLAATLFGVAAGYALPTTALARLVPTTDGIARVEPYFSRALLLLAAGGAAASWLAAFGSWGESIATLERRLERLLRRGGIVIVLTLMLIVASSGGWGGHYTGHPSSIFEILNLMPWSDAITYFGSALDRATVDAWGAVPARRPFAQALRDGLVFMSGYSHTWTILLQALLLTMSMSVAAQRILAWKGVWASIAFVGLAIALVRGFVGSMMTEPLGCALAFISCALLCDALRFRSPSHAIAATVWITLALVTRAGSMLTVPYLILWIAVAHATTARSKLWLGALAAVGPLAIFAVNSLLTTLYAPPGITSATSLSLTLCGLSVGGSWADCYHRLYADEIVRFGQNDPAILHFLLEKAIENITNAPGTLVRALATNVADYIVQLPHVFFPNAVGLTSRLAIPMLVLIACRLLQQFAKRDARREAIFWLGFLASTAASAAIIYADDGARAMRATYVIIAMFLAFGFSCPLRRTRGEVERTSNASLSFASAGVIIAFALAMPAVSHAVTSKWVRANVGPVHAGKDEAILLGGWGITGFLVIPDEAEKPVQVPAVSYSDFRSVPEVSAIPQSYGVDIAQFKPPFAFVIGMRLNETCCYYVTSPDVLLKRDVKAWRLTPPQGTEWKAIRAMTATPLQ